ncbi:hypothetical protein DAEQUDRAFT_49410 [Daedalea quercina L-15889]|uniref:Transmembrane protein n=1 Tax=Daedalea quercina L-15889 TaxID=1314783 RepID=A0A165LAU4_9APHY|nr:hypothetical protein DAEQUDRAFT_49410 [Daedalea quercina L-15889]
MVTTAQILFAISDRETNQSAVCEAGAVNNGEGDSGRMKPRTIVAMVVFIVLFSAAFVVLIMLAWPHHRTTALAARSQQTQRRSGAPTAAVPPARQPHRQPTAELDPPPPYTASRLPPYDGWSHSEAAAEGSVSMHAIASGSSPSLPLRQPTPATSSRVLDSARAGAPADAELQAPPAAHVAHRDLE